MIMKHCAAKLNAEGHGFVRSLKNRSTIEKLMVKNLLETVQMAAIFVLAGLHLSRCLFMQSLTPDT